jgi:hypothetical protein
VASSADRSTFAVELVDETSGPAEQAASALGRLKTKLDADTKALAAMQKAMRNLKGGTQASSQAARQLSAQISAQKASIASAQARFLALGGSFNEAKKESQGFLASLAAAPGPLGQFAGKLQGMSSGLVGFAGAAAVGVIGVVALVGAIVSLTAAVVNASISLAQYAIAQADARRSELLHLEGLTTIRRYYGLAAGSATELQGAIDRVSRSSALGRGEIQRYTERLYRMGLRGRDLSSALEAVTITASVQGEQMGDRVAGLAAGLIRTGGSVQVLADRVRTRLGGIARRQLLSLDVQARRLREGLSRLFDGLNIEPFLEGLNEVTTMFAESTASSRALRTIITSLFNPLLQGAGAAGPVMRRFFQGLVIGALLFSIGILRVRNLLRDTFGDSELFGNIDALELALMGGLVVFGAIAVSLVTAAAAIGVVVAGFYMLYRAIQPILQLGQTLGRAISGTDWAGLGRSIVDGLAQGITSRYDQVQSAIHGIATSATDALSQALGIQSPSRVFASLGLEIPRGLAQGVEEGSSVVSDSTATMAGFATDEAQGGASRGAPRGATTIGPFYIEISAGSNDPREQAESFRDQLAQVLEGLSVQLGAE